MRTTVDYQLTRTTTPERRHKWPQFRSITFIVFGALLASPLGPVVLNLGGFYVPELVVTFLVFSVYGFPPRFARSWHSVAIFLTLTIPLFPLTLSPAHDLLDALGEWRSLVLVLIVAGLVNRAIAEEQSSNARYAGAIRVALPIAAGSLVGSISYFVFLRADVGLTATSAGDLKAAVAYGAFFALAYVAWNAGARGLAVASVVAAGLLGALAAYRVGIVLAAAAMILLFVTSGVGTSARFKGRASSTMTVGVLALVTVSALLLAQRLDESVLLRTQVNAKLADLVASSTGGLDELAENESYRIAFFRASVANIDSLILPHGYGALSYLGQHALDVPEKSGRPASSLDNGLYYLLFHIGLLPTLVLFALLATTMPLMRRSTWFALTLAGAHLLISATAVVFPVHAVGTGVLLGVCAGNRTQEDA